jgi:hypothetical protein
LDTNNVNKWLTLLANIGVLVGIVFLVLEIQQSNRIALATTEMSVWDKHQSLNEIVLADDNVAELLVKASTPNVELSAVDREKLSAYLYVSINTWLAIEVAYSNGMLTRTSFDDIRGDIDGILHYYPAMRPIMQEAVGDYPLKVHTHVYTEMRKALEESE